MRMRHNEFKATAAIAGLVFVLWFLPAFAAQEKTIEVTYDFNEPHIEIHGGYARLTIPGCENLHRVGEPALPFKTARIVLPSGFAANSVRVQPALPAAVLDGNWLVDYGRTPVHPGAPGSGLASLPDDQPAAAIYNSKGPYPHQRAELISVQRLEGYDVALVRIFPIEYLPATGQLLFNSRLTLHLTASLTPAKPGNLRAVRSRNAAGSRIAGFVDNPDQLAENQTKSLSLSSPPIVYDYLLITKAFLLPSFQDLLSQKQRDGLSVKAELTEKIATNYAGRDLAEKIRNYIKFAYTNWGVSYVLLGGDTQIVPCRYAYVNNGFAGAEFIPCDLYYGCLDGSWNSNSNSYWGEPVDGEQGADVDLLAEVCVGRAPVETVGEAAIFVEKSVRYESETNPRPPEILLLGAYLGYYAPGVHAQGGDMFDPIAPFLNYFTVKWLDDRPSYGSQWDADDAISALNRSPNFAFYAGHGDVDSLLRMSDVNNLTNSYPFLAYSVSCNAGQFDNDIFSPDAIGEDLVKNNRSGSVAAILNSRVGWFDPQQEWKFSGEFQIKFCEELFASGQTRLGMANQLSKQALLGQVESAGVMTYRWCYYEITLLGDPHLPIRATLAPSSFSVSISNVVDSQTCFLTWPSEPARLYSVYASTNLAEAFVLVASNLPATPPLNTYSETTANRPVNSYKIAIQP